MWAGAIRTTLAVATPFLLVGALYLSCSLQPVQEIAREQGVLPMLARAVELGANGTSVSGTLLGFGATQLVAQLSSGNADNERAVRELGVPRMMVDLIRLAPENESGARVQLAIAAVQTYVQSGSNSSAAISEAGGVESLVKVMERFPDEEVARGAAQLLAIMTSSANPQVQDRVRSGAGIDALLGLVQTGSEAVVGCAVWALSNSVADNRLCQNAVRDADGIESLTRQLWRASSWQVQEPALAAVGNLAVNNARNQDALREAGALEAVVKLLEPLAEAHSRKNGQRGAAAAGDAADRELDKAKDQALAGAALIARVADVARNNAAVRAAIREVGGIQVVAKLLQTSSLQDLVVEDWSSWKALVVVPDENATQPDSLDGVLELFQQLQSEMEGKLSTEPPEPTPETQPKGGMAADVPAAGAKLQVATVYSIVLERLQRLREEELVERAAWVLAVLTANNPANQNALRQAGGLEMLLGIVESCSARSARVAALALGNALHGNRENQATLQGSGAVQKILSLLPDTADTDVMNALARILKIIAREGVLTGSHPSMVLGHLGSRLAVAIRLVTGLSSSPELALAVAAGGVLLLLLLAVLLLRCGRAAASRSKPPQPTAGNSVPNGPVDAGSKKAS